MKTKTFRTRSTWRVWRTEAGNESPQLKPLPACLEATEVADRDRDNAAKCFPAVGDASDATAPPSPKIAPRPQLWRPWPFPPEQSWSE